MPTRYDIERAAEASGLHPAARDIIFALCRCMQQGNTIILQQHSPSLTRLARRTGWSRSTIKRFLNLLEERKWIERHRPPEDLARTVYLTTLYVVHEPDTLGPVEAGPGPVEAGPGPVEAGPGPVEAGPGPEGAANQICSDQVSDLETDPEIAIVIRELENRTGRRVSPQWAATIRDQIVNRPGVRNRPAYLKRVLTTDPNPKRFVPTEQPDPHASLCERCGKSGHTKSECPYL